MNVSILNESFAWNLSRSAYDEIDELPLMQSPGPVLVILASYFLFVFKIGPAFMRKREAFKLQIPLAIYNAFQVIFSAYLVQKYFFAMVEMGFFPRTCYMDLEIPRKWILHSIWLYFAAKLTELLDTVFFVLRKKDKQVTFLHTYHHSIMLIGTWATLKYSPTQTLGFIGLANSLVHVVMYTYYGLAAFGPRFEKYLKWKKYITTLQLIQFVSIIVQFLLTVKYCDCPTPKLFSILIASNVLFFLFLFLNFYRQSYIKKSSMKSKNIPESSEVSKKTH